jgi:hypothetical protein
MTIPRDVTDQIRRGADFACEYCGVAETDTGGELTVDHFQPRAHGGTDDLSNLLYCCHRCNLYKADYWPMQASAPVLWNPRREPLHVHFLRLADGTLYPITAAGVFTLKRLRLNRPPLVAYRLRRQMQDEELQLLTRYREVIALVEQLQRQYASLLEEHQALLDEQRALLNLLLRGEE